MVEPSFNSRKEKPPFESRRVRTQPHSLTCFPIFSSSSASITFMRGNCFVSNMLSLPLQFSYDRDAVANRQHHASNAAVGGNLLIESSDRARVVVFRIQGVAAIKHV